MRDRCLTPSIAAACDKRPPLRGQRPLEPLRDHRDGPTRRDDAVEIHRDHRHVQRLVLADEAAVGLEARVDRAGVDEERALRGPGLPVHVHDRRLGEHGPLLDLHRQLTLAGLHDLAGDADPIADVERDELLEARRDL